MMMGGEGRGKGRIREEVVSACVTVSGCVDVGGRVYGYEIRV
jgi:hypothetical protein